MSAVMVQVMVDPIAQAENEVRKAEQKEKPPGYGLGGDQQDVGQGKEGLTHQRGHEAEKEGRAYVTDTRDHDEKEDFPFVPTGNSSDQDEREPVVGKSGVEKRDTDRRRRDAAERAVREHAGIITNRAAENKISRSQESCDRFSFGYSPPTGHSPRLTWIRCSRPSSERGTGSFGLSDSPSRTIRVTPRQTSSGLSTEIR